MIRWCNEALKLRRILDPFWWITSLVICVKYKSGDKIGTGLPLHCACGLSQIEEVAGM